MPDALMVKPVAELVIPADVAPFKVLPALAEFPAITPPEPACENAMARTALSATTPIAPSRTVSASNWVWVPFRRADVEPVCELVADTRPKPIKPTLTAVPLTFCAVLRLAFTLMLPSLRRAAP